MIEYNPSEVLFSLHIPKAGGNSFVKVLENWFNPIPFPFIYNHPRLYRILTPLNLDIYIQRLLGNKLFYHYKNHHLNKLPRVIPTFKGECIHGHFDPDDDAGNLFQYYPGARQFVTVLRDPMHMHLSLFFYMKRLYETDNWYWNGEVKNKQEFINDVDWWLEERKFYMLHFMPWTNVNFDNYLEIINNNFVHVGVVENFQRSIDLLAEKMKFKSVAISHENATKWSQKPSDSSVRIFKEKYTLEYAIYNHAVSINR